jgi:hypothetical protein
MAQLLDAGCTAPAAIIVLGPNAIPSWAAGHCVVNLFHGHPLGLAHGIGLEVFRGPAL